MVSSSVLGWHDHQSRASNHVAIRDFQTPSLDYFHPDCTTAIQALRYSHRVPIYPSGERSGDGSTPNEERSVEWFARRDGVEGIVEGKGDAVTWVDGVWDGKHRPVYQVLGEDFGWVGSRGA